MKIFIMKNFHLNKNGSYCYTYVCSRMWSMYCLVCIYMCVCVRVCVCACLCTPVSVCACI